MRSFDPDLKCELGTIFRPNLPGSITHLRVYALASETGDHVARVWRNANSTLIAGPFTWNYGGATGWITLDIPDVQIDAIHPDGSDGFQEDGGLRIRGGQSASTGFPKHSFHVFFRRKYGAAKLHFPLFGADGTDEFDTIDWRCEHGYAYADPYPYSDEFTAIRDVFCRDLWAATGYASTRSRPYHLYLNGLADFAPAPTNRVINFTPPSGQTERYYRLVTAQQP